MNRHLSAVPVICIVLILVLSACAALSSPSTFTGGETLTPERLEEISAQVFATLPETGETEPAQTIAPEELAYDGTVYWLDGGRVWHTRSDCYHIRNAETVLEGSTADAVAAGKTGLCATCRKQEANTGTP